MDAPNRQPVVARDPYPLEDIIDQDQAAVPQKDVPTNLMYEVQTDPYDRSSEKPDAGQSPITFEQPVEDIPEFNPGNEYQQQDIKYASNLAANNLARKIVGLMEIKW